MGSYSNYTFIQFYYAGTASKFEKQSQKLKVMALILLLVYPKQR